MKTNNRFRFYVLFARTEKQDKLQKALKKAFPEERGKVFLPRAEYYVRKTKKTEIRPLFPGYVFIYTDLGIQKLHEFINSHRTDVDTFVRELGLYGARKYGESLLENGEKRNEETREEGEYELTDLTEEEAGFLTLMLDDENVVRMSEGYSEKGRYIVMEGPLKTLQDRIVRVDRHNRIAYLNFAIGELKTMAGLEIKPKRCYFPDDEEAPAMLEDGTEINLLELGKRMMGG